jgi:hypothetical protein
VTIDGVKFTACQLRSRVPAGHEEPS